MKKQYGRLFLALLLWLLISVSAASANNACVSTVSILIDQLTSCADVEALQTEVNSLLQHETLFGSMTYRTSEEMIFSSPVAISAMSENHPEDQPQINLFVSFEGNRTDALFPCTAERSYDAVILWNGGADSTYTKVIQLLTSELVGGYTDSSSILWDCEPVSVFINDTYWGIYLMMEAPDALSISQHEGMEDTVLKPTVISYLDHPIMGDNTAWKELLKTVRALAPAENEEDAQWLNDHLDTESFLDYLALKVYLGDMEPMQAFFYRYPGGKWKCAARHMDASLFQASYHAPAAYFGDTDGVYDNTLFRKIIEAPENRSAFLEKVAALSRALPAEVMQRELDRCAALIEPEMGKHLQRWSAYIHPETVFTLPTDTEDLPANWQARMERLRNKTIVNRPYYVYVTIQEWFDLTDTEMSVLFGEKPTLTVF